MLEKKEEEKSWEERRKNGGNGGVEGTIFSWESNPLSFFSSSSSSCLLLPNVSSSTSNSNSRIGNGEGGHTRRAGMVRFSTPERRLVEEGD